MENYASDSNYTNQNDYSNVKQTRRISAWPRASLEKNFLFWKSSKELNFV